MNQPPRYTISITETRHTATAIIVCCDNGRTEKKTFRSRYGEARLRAEEWAKHKLAVYTNRQDAT